MLWCKLEECVKDNYMKGFILKASSAVEIYTLLLDST